MKKIYLKYPYIKTITANITHRKTIESGTAIKCDRTIFLPREENFNYLDVGHINNIKVTDVYIDNGSIYHVLASKPTTSKLVMKIDGNNRQSILQQSTALFILKYYLKKIFGIEDILYSVKRECSNITFKNRIFDIYDISNLFEVVNNSISNLIPIQSEMKLFGNNEYIEARTRYGDNYDFDLPVLSNTSEIICVDPVSVCFDDDKISIDFIAGNKLLAKYRNIYKTSMSN